MRFQLIAKTTILTITAFMLILTGICLAAEDADNKEAALSAGTVAVVNGVKISAQELEQKLQMIQARYASMGMPIQGQQLVQLRESILENLIEKQLLLEESKAEEINIDETQLAQEIDRLKAQFEDEADFQKKLASANYTEESLKQEMRENLAIRKLIEEKIESRVSVTDSEIEAYYQENQKEFETPEQIRARHILIKSGPEASDAQKAEARKKIAEIQTKLENGQDFSELAKAESEGPSAEKGGDLGFFGRGQMVESFDQAAFALEPGQVSDIVETQFGYHLIKMEDKKAASKKSFDEVNVSIREKLRQEKIMQDLEPYMESLKRKYPVEKNLPESPQE